MSARPPRMPGMTIGDLRKAIDAMRSTAEGKLVIIALPGGQQLTLDEVAVDFRNGFFVLVLKAGVQTPRSAGSLAEAIRWAMERGGAYGRNLHESKPVVIEVSGGRMWSLDKAAAARTGGLVLKARAQWPPEEFR